jgi:hypothetical protein
MRETLTQPTISVAVTETRYVYSAKRTEVPLTGCTQTAYIEFHAESDDARSV